MEKKQRLEARSVWWENRLLEIENSPNPARFPKKGFTPTCPEVPVLEDYNSCPGPDYWAKFPVIRNECGGSPFKIDIKKLEEYVMAADPDFSTLLLLKVLFQPPLNIFIFPHFILT